MSTFRRLLTVFALSFALGTAACTSSVVGLEDCDPQEEQCRGGGHTHGSDN